MNLQQLEYIVAVDKFRHFAQAARSCGVAQSTLSALIQKLEADLGCPSSIAENIRFIQLKPEQRS